MKHRLKSVINMPEELFQPNAAAHTAITVFETHRPHRPEDKVVVLYSTMVFDYRKIKVEPIHSITGRS